MLRCCLQVLPGGEEMEMEILAQLQAGLSQGRIQSKARGVSCLDEGLALAAVPERKVEAGRTGEPTAPSHICFLEDFGPKANFKKQQVKALPRPVQWLVKEKVHIWEFSRNRGPQILTPKRGGHAQRGPETAT